MRKSAKALLLVITALIGSLGLTVAAAFSAALAFGATALIVPGTGTHDVLTDTKYRDNAADRYINPAGVACVSTGGCDIAGVDYPAEFFPFVIFDGWCPGLQCDTWNVSVDQGVSNLDGALTPFKDPGNTEDVIVFGYSQGGAVVSRELYNLAGLDQSVKDRITVVTIGNINNPRGLFSRLGFLPTIPGLDITFGPQLPTDIGIKSTNYSFEYDPVGDAPSYWGNPVAMLNAVFAFEYVHGFYLVPDDDSDAVMPYGYGDDSLAAAIADEANRKYYQDATFVLIPQRGALPMYQPVLDIGDQLGVGGLVKPLVALVNPVTKLFANLGYDRVTNPGIPQYLSILPFNPFTFNPISFSVEFVQAIAQGVQDALNGGASLDVADSQAPETLSTLASFSRLASDTTPKPVVTNEDEHENVSTLAVEQTGDSTPAVDADAEAKAGEQAAAEQAAKAAAEQAAKDAADAAAAKEAADAADKAAADKAKEAAEAEAAAEKTEKAAADQEAADQAEANPAAEAADKVRQSAADNAKDAGAAGDTDAPAAADAPVADGPAEGAAAAA